jgi:ring-1,2-phenylacetyl-CoA epoxidase subunit PaaE
LDPLYKRLQISAIVTETQNAKTFVLQPLNWKPEYKAGQFLTLVFETNFGEKRRSFSISSAPLLKEPLTITVKKLDNGEFSRWLLYKAAKDDILYASGTGGFFVLPENTAARQFFFLAAGSGITPCYSLIRTILATTNEKVVLIYSNRSEDDTIFYEQLRSLQSQYKERFIIRFLFSNVQDVFKSRLSNWLLQQLLHQYLVNKDEAIFYLCGPVDYMIMAIITLKANGIGEKNIIKENYSALPRLSIPRPPDIDPHNVTIRFNGEEFILTVQYPQTILASAKANNIPLPYSCEAGRCGSCVATCISGKVWMAYNEVLMDEEIEKGRILTCQAFPIDGDVVIEIS